eukprot:TRINITY_DN14668_c0_g1_i3.p2 TRINITY_DN14668_c0_g1~~TRINITY_DN14668_c0_g1_i3.p2  ORF type:complete len:150 (-),score=14.42 TRINITY_DN14668_c0_g1_i3:21-470(-)
MLHCVPWFCWAITGLKSDGATDKTAAKAKACPKDTQEEHPKQAEKNPIHLTKRAEAHKRGNDERESETSHRPAGKAPPKVDPKQCREQEHDTSIQCHTQEQGNLRYALALSGGIRASPTEVFCHALAINGPIKKKERTTQLHGRWPLGK